MPKQENDRNLPKPYKPDELDIRKSPNFRDLARFGFTDKLPELFRDINTALADVSPDPQTVRLSLTPNLETPILDLERKFDYPRPKLEITFQPGGFRNRARLTIGKEISDESEEMFYFTGNLAIEKPLEPLDITKIRGTGRDEIITRADLFTAKTEHDWDRMETQPTDRIIPVDLDTLKNFVRHAFPRKQATLYSFVPKYVVPEHFNAQEVKDLETAGFSISAETGAININLYRLTNNALQILPAVGYSIRISAKKSTQASEEIPPAFLYVTLKRNEEVGGYFEIRRLQYQGNARGIEKVLALLYQAYQQDPTGWAKFKERLVKKRYKEQ